MTREDSKMMQGVAILMMIFYHLFNPHDVPSFSNTVIGNMARASNPVPMYVLLSGVGLYYTYLRQHDNNRIKRCFRLYLRYWIILSAFILICIFMHYKINLDADNILYNYSAFKTTYYLPSWFILPYVILAICYPLIFRFVDKLGLWLTLIVFYVIYMAASYLNNYDFFRHNAFQSLYIVFPFVVGGILAKYNLAEKAKRFFEGKHVILPYLLVIILVVIRYFVYTGAVITFYSASLILLLVAARKPMWLQRMLLSLGKASVNMWLIHAWLCWYLFADYFYALKFTPLIFALATFVCYIMAKLFDIIINPILNIINLNK